MTSILSFGIVSSAIHFAYSWAVAREGNSFVFLLFPLVLSRGFFLHWICKLKFCVIFFAGFYIRGSVHRSSRLKKSNKMQLYTDIYLLLNYCTCFGRPSRPSSGVHKTVVAASGTDHTMWGATTPQRVRLIN